MENSVLLFGGCYSNLQATGALLDFAASRGIGPDNMICTGDIIAYGADARATLRLIRDAGIRSIAGNCEEALAAGAGDCGCGFAPESLCNALAAEWYAHAQREIEDEDRRYMASLPKSLRFVFGGKRFCVVHGNAERTNAFVFPSAGNLELSRQVELAGTDAIIAGHAGIPFTRGLGDKIWHNPGSIGLPANDGTPRVWCSILEVKDGKIVLTPHALEYDFAAAATAMRRRNLPEGYAAALETGVWPSLDILPEADRKWTGVKLEARRAAGAPPLVALRRLETLWVNTGTLCNIACINCFMESGPANDTLAYMTAAAFRAALDGAPATVNEVGFTGGEPFMNPEIMTMLQSALAAGNSVLVLTNAMRPMHRHAEALHRLAEAYPKKILVRVSVDHYRASRHDELRGRGAMAQTRIGLRLLAEAGVIISVAARTPWGETEAMMRAGFAGLFGEIGLALDAQDAAQLVLFPEMDVASPTEPVTADALAAVPAEKPLMCATSRMVVLRKGAQQAEITPCTLLPHRGLKALEDEVTLDHAHCARFCVYGGASCAGAPG